MDDDPPMIDAETWRAVAAQSRPTMRMGVPSRRFPSLHCYEHCALECDGDECTCGMDRVRAAITAADRLAEAAHTVADMLCDDSVGGVLADERDRLHAAVDAYRRARGEP